MDIHPYHDTTPERMYTNSGTVCSLQFSTLVKLQATYFVPGSLDVTFLRLIIRAGVGYLCSRVILHFTLSRVVDVHR